MVQGDLTAAEPPQQILHLGTLQPGDAASLRSHGLDRIGQRPQRGRDDPLRSSQEQIDVVRQGAADARARPVELALGAAA